MQPIAILETSLYVDNLAAAEEFYATVLGLALHSRAAGRHVFFHCGDGMLLLFNAAATRNAPAGFPAHGATGPGHVAFRIAPDETAAWRTRLTRSGVAIEAEIEWPRGGYSLYFRDPAGNCLELATPQLWQS